MHTFYFRHVSGSPGALDDASGSFPGIMDAMFELNRNDTPENRRVVQQQIALATYKINAAYNMLQL